MHLTPTPVSAVVAPSPWPSDLSHLANKFVSGLSADKFERDRQIQGVYDLVKKYGDRIAMNRFTWEKYSSGKDHAAAEWLPVYTYKPNISLSEIWEEFSNGLGGYLSTRQLKDGWKACWRRDISGLKTERGRRKKVTDLIEDLSQKTNWNTGLALRFLQDTYPIPSKNQKYLKSVRSFIDHIQNRDTGFQARQLIMDTASSYCG